MSRTTTLFSFALILTLVVVILLATGSSLLTIALDSDNSIPSGTLITWIGMISLPLTVYWGAKEFRKPSNSLNRVLSILLKIIIIAGVLWVPISYLLAGNLSFTFSERETFQGGQDAMKLFWYLSYGIGIGTILILFAYWTSLLFSKGKTGTNSGDK